MKNILVTGGAGFIGSHTCITLLEKGYKLIVIDSNINSSPDSLFKIRLIVEKKLIISNQLIFKKGNIGNFNFLREVFLSAKKENNQIDAVIHWSTNMKQGRFIVENKGGRTIKKNANGSFSKHQLLRPHSIVSDAVSSHELPCEVKALYCRFSKSNNQGCWDIDLDLYGVSKDEEIYWEKGLSLINIPSS